MLWILVIGLPVLAVPVMQSMDNATFLYLIPSAISTAVIGFWLDKARGATAGVPTATAPVASSGAGAGGMRFAGLFALILALGVLAAVMVPVFVDNTGLGSLSLWHVLILFGVLFLGYSAFRPRQQ
jgi:hypothetical protein